jgi:hypothetical protein
MTSMPPIGSTARMSTPAPTPSVSLAMFSIMLMP